MSKVYVVNCSQAASELFLPPDQWRLSQAGILLLMPIVEASLWQNVSVIYHAPEVRAQQTAWMIAQRWDLPLEVDWDLRELDLRGRLDRPEFAALIGDYLLGATRHSLIEEYELAASRIMRCIERLAAKHRGESFAIVSHEKLLTILFSSLLGTRLGLEAWRSVRRPDLAVINLETRQVEAGFLSSPAGDK
ncbi:MAG: histidine phosphatase family protein [Bacillota bacterium]|jgi:broad specificity phosphatase PhoE